LGVFTQTNGLQLWQVAVSYSNLRCIVICFNFTIHCLDDRHASICYRWYWW